MLVTVSLCLTSLTCIAGESGAHGGNAVTCVGKKTVILDYYHASLPTIGNPNVSLVNIDKMSIQEVVDYFRKKFSKTALGADFESALTDIGPLENWISSAAGDLKDIGDSNETYNLPANCKILQVAARQGTIVYADPKIIDQLSEGQKGILVVHEALYYLAENLSGQQTSENVRTIVRVVLETSSTDTDVFKATLKIGSYPAALLVGHTYRKLDNKEGYCDMKFVGFDRFTKKLTATYFFNDPADPLNDSRGRYCLERPSTEWNCESDGVNCSREMSNLVVLDNLGLNFKITFTDTPNTINFFQRKQK